MKFDVVVVGGGPAGMSAAIGSAKNGASTLIIERNDELGGILNQCIHNGFGLHYYKEELTGPEFANRLSKEVKKYANITILTQTFVTEIKQNKVVISNKDGVQEVETKAIVLATGAREKTPANITLTGSRPAGLMTAGVAQKMVNTMGLLPGKEVVILGSGDIGLIMARRLTLEGAKVKAVLEINKTTSGLRRNVLQCLDDFNIPLFFQTTVFSVVGKDRVEGIYYGKVDDNYNQLKETQKFLKCDALILSVGLTPETDIVKGLKTMRVTGGGEVDEYYMTNIKGLFTCGNVLHIHDLVDNVCIESENAGRCASLFAKKKLDTSRPVNVIAGNGLTYVVPSTAYINDNKLVCRFRLKNKITRTNIVAKSGGVVLAKRFVLAGTPGEMQSLEIEKANATGDIIVEVE